MQGRHRYSTSQLFNFTKDSYLERTSRPIYAIVFLLPFIIFYEFGTILINTDVLNQSQVRVVAFVWLQNLLEYVGFSSRVAWVAPPLVVVVILIALQLVSGKQWRFYLGDVWPMVVECALLAVPLIVFSLFLSSPAKSQGGVDQSTNSAIRVQSTSLLNCSLAAGTSLPLSVAAATDNGQNSQTLLANMVTGIGAGIYEELIFRLILMCLLMMLFQDIIRLDHKNSVILSVLISAALFSAHHHIVFVNGQFATTTPFTWPEFGFRTIAGVYFAVLFAIRGFGITAGTHAFYDIIATIINAVFFQQ